MGLDRPAESSAATWCPAIAADANRAAKDDGLEAAVREANRQVNMKDDGVPANVPEELGWYARMVPGLLGAQTPEQPQ
jgi:hypothetical protein